MNTPLLEIITIDGPVGVGKSAVAARLAARLGWRHLDTGAMYRAVALLALRSGAPSSDAAACLAIARAMTLEFQPGDPVQRVIADGNDVTEAIRTPEVNRAVSDVADMPAVREELGRRQRAMGEAGRSAVEGRDMGTIVFPDARWKFFLDADPRERARRRWLQQGGESGAMSLEAVAGQLAERDLRDRTRPVGALRIAEDAIVIDTTEFDEPRVIGLIGSIVAGGGSGA